MRVPQSYIQKCKVVAHVFQVLLIFIGGCITIAILTKDGETGGATKYFFALGFLTAPAIIYLVMTPMWSRAKRFANAYAFLALDALYTILWFAAFIAVAMWNAEGIREGAKDKKIDGNGNCTTFKFGPEDKCNLSRITVGFGAAVFVFFAVTTGISVYYFTKFRKEGVLPYESDKMNPHHASGETQKDNAWSTEMGDHHNDSDDDDRRTERGGNQEEDEYALLNSTETDEGRHPGRPLSWGDDRFGRGDHGHTPIPVAPYAQYNDNPDALSPGGYEEYRHQSTTSGSGPTPYPPTPGGAGYSFSGGGNNANDRY
ncbi:hypothetical protein BU24DRAFT_465147 [Aaosphaeria arxii CBS 175.79]|uniref:MARVEL domain-containing protein n=1 Tax=Aaosphaeria arxii CBS 175.79 TaxID=1450172 RepID=A0A6A5XHR9_9PLEO|nr:uncharacterized protein BU24DRAFT_465147 [Aaosphaeria arxii CBS 175.79]KAF2012788.1 hypothetical protein BU24DRAFT_465147 [Aaosphaeria arxii CBS 175.79]